MADTIADPLVNTSEPDGQDYINIEAYIKAGKDIPKDKKYVIRIDRTEYKVEVSSMTGRELLTLAEKTPVERYLISQKLHGGQLQEIMLDTVVDFTASGTERFVTLPLDQTEG